ncbi:MAG TPA: DUF6263 family protein [Gemmatales bacterium]|nr:DUF6263 family protein [Gemmatales bacterium]
MLFLLLLLTPLQTDGVNLRWQFKQGDTFNQESRSQLNQTVKVGDKEFKQDLVHTTLVKYTVSEVTPMGITLEQQIESMKATAPDGQPSPGNNAVLNQLQGAILKAKLSPDLQVKELEGYDELLKRLAGDDPSIQRVAKALLSEEQLKNAISHSLGFVPQKATSPGATWNREMTIALGPLGSVRIGQAFKFEGMESVDGVSLAKITFQPTVAYSAPKPDASNPELSITQGNIKLKEGSGVVYFDPAAGRLHHSTLKLTLTGDLTAKISGKEIPLTFDQTQTIDVRMKK